MSINKLVSIRDAIYNAFEDTGIDITSQTPVFMRWAVDAERKIGSYYGWKKLRSVLDIKGCRAKLPCGAMRVQYVLIGDHGCDCEDLINNIGRTSLSLNKTSEVGFLVVDTPSKVGDYYTDQRWEVQNNHIVFPSNLDAQKCTIQYLGYEEDKNGFIVVSENHIPAIVEYIKKMYAERSRFSPVKMDLADIQRHANQWIEEKSIAIANDAGTIDGERSEIVAMLHDPYVGFGLDFNMY